MDAASAYPYCPGTAVPPHITHERPFPHHTHSTTVYENAQDKLYYEAVIDWGAIPPKGNFPLPTTVWFQHKWDRTVVTYPRKAQSPFVDT